MQNSRGRARAGARARLLNFGILDKKKLVGRGGTVGGGGSVGGRGSARAAERDDELAVDLIAAPRDALCSQCAPDRLVGDALRRVPARNR